MLPYVGIFLVGKIFAGLALLAVEIFAPGTDLPVNSTMVNVCAVGLAMTVYHKKVGFKPLKHQYVEFGIGAAIVDVLLSIGTVLLAILVSGQSVSTQSIAAALDMSGETNSAMALIIFASVFGALLTGVIAAFFAWIMTRSLPENEADTFE